MSPAPDFIVLAATLSVVPSVPVAGLALILGVDRFMSECRALTNFVGNAVATIVVARWEKAVEPGQLAAAFRGEGGELTEVESDALQIEGRSDVPWLGPAPLAPDEGEQRLFERIDLAVGLDVAADPVGFGRIDLLGLRRLVFMIDPGCTALDEAARGFDRIAAHHPAEEATEAAAGVGDECLEPRRLVAFERPIGGISHQMIADRLDEQGLPALAHWRRRPSHP